MCACAPVTCMGAVRRLASSAVFGLVIWLLQRPVNRQLPRACCTTAGVSLDTSMYATAPGLEQDGSTTAARNWIRNGAAQPRAITT
jgi:hypothetical protein